MFPVLATISVLLSTFHSTVSTCKTGLTFYLINAFFCLAGGKLIFNFPPEIDQIALGNWTPSEAFVKTVFFPPTPPKGLLLSVLCYWWRMESIFFWRTSSFSPWVFWFWYTQHFKCLMTSPSIPFFSTLVYSFNYLQTCLSGHFVLVEVGWFFFTTF